MSAIATVTFVRANPSTDVGSLAFAEHALTPWLVAVGLLALVIDVVALWAAWGRHPWAAIGVAVALGGALLPLAAAWPEPPDHWGPWLLACSAFVPVGVTVGAAAWSRRAVPGRVVLVGGLGVSGSV